MEHIVAKGRIAAGAIAAALWVFLGFGLGVSAFAQGPAPAQPFVDKLVLDDTIQPVSADEVTRALDRANSDGASALLIEMNTPGGLLDSMRDMVGGILRSRVPVIVYVGPSGARAGSAGFFILESADVAAMAPGTEAGAAHPVFEFGGQPDNTEMQKVENDAEAFLRSYVTKRNRSTDAAIAAVQSSHSYTAEESLNQHLIDLIANSDTELLKALDGREITRMDGSKMTLHLAGARVQLLRKSLRDGVLGWLVDPNIALLLLVGGALLIYLEFNAPGTIVPGALGTLMVLLAIFALQLAAHSIHRRVASGGGIGFVTARSQVWRPRRAGDRGNSVPDVWNADAGGGAGARDGNQPGDCDRGERGVWRDHGFSGAAGGSRSEKEIAHRRGCDGGLPGDRNGGTYTARPRAGGGRDLGGGGERSGGQGNGAPRDGARPDAAAS